MESVSPLPKIMRLFLAFLIFSVNIIKIKSATCKDNKNIANKDCFTDVIIFNNMKYRAAHSSVNQNGVFIMELSNDAETGNRVFYGLKSNGRYYFPNEIIARYESINSFIALKDDVNKEKEYFLSISTYYCFMEIYDLNEESVSYDAIYTYDYLSNQIFSFRFDIHETKYSGTLTYYLVFCHSTANHEAV